MARAHRRPLAAAATCLAALLVAGAACDRRPEPVRIGFVGGLTGRVADLGISGRNGATLAVEVRNEHGGVAGRPVELLVRDDAQDADTARRVDRELMDLGVAAIVGHMTSAMSVAAVPLANERRVALVSPTTTTMHLAGIDDEFFRVSSTTRDYAAKMAAHLLGRGLAAVAVVHERGNAAYTESWLEDFRRAFAAGGGAVVRAVPFTSGTDVGFEDLARELIAPGADGVVVIAGAMDAAMICQQVRKLGSALPIAAAEWASTEQLLQFGGAAAEGMTVSQFFDRDSGAPAFVEFRRRYRERFGEPPGFAAVAGYDAASLALEAVAQARPGESVSDTIRRLRRFDGLQGPIVLDAFGDARRENVLAVVERGSFRILR